MYLPNIEKIIAKSRNIKLKSEELRQLKKEYEDLNKNIKRIKVLPRILEEADIFEEVDKINKMANSLPDEDCNSDFEFSNEDIKNDVEKNGRPNSADDLEHMATSSIAAVHPLPMYTVNQPPNSARSKINRNADMNTHIDLMNLPPILENYQRGTFDADILNKTNDANSFELPGYRVSKTPKLYLQGMHKPHKSIPINLLAQQNLLNVPAKSSRDGSNTTKTNVAAFDKTSLLAKKLRENRQRTHRKDS